MKTLHKILLLSLFIILLISLGLSKSIKYQYTRSVVAEEQILIVNRGDSISSISNKLMLGDKSKFWFSKMARINGVDKVIKAGEFLIPEHASIKDLLDIISSNNTIDYKVTIIEGYQKYQIPEIFNGIENMYGEIPFISQEGVFMPDTYYYKTGATKDSVLKRANEAMENYLSDSWGNREKSIPIKTKREALILASIIEKETAQNDEYKLVSSVFMNRLKRGMKLQADSTAIYGVTNGEKKFNRKLFKGDLAKQNEYNTYYIKGLPKSPICNPGKKAIDAVMHPANTDYLYFVADGTGGHVFAKSGKEHERNVVKWRKIKNGL